MNRLHEYGLTNGVTDVEESRRRLLLSHYAGAVRSHYERAHQFLHYMAMSMHECVSGRSSRSSSMRLMQGRVGAQTSRFVQPR